MPRYSPESSLVDVTRQEQIEADEAWDKAWVDELAGARRRTLCRALRHNESPTLRDLLSQIGEGRCDLVGTPTAGKVRLGDLVRRDGEGPFVIHLLDQLGLSHADPLEDAERLGLAEIDRPLVDLLD